MADPRPRPAFYAAGPGPAGEWWTLLHPPYTAWHLAYVAIGAALAPDLDGGRLAVSLLAFLAAVGVSAHALDEVHDRPLGTHIGSRALWSAAIIGLAVAIAAGVAGIVVVGWVLVPFVVIGPILVIGYNLEWFGGRIHTDVGFATAWGAFPVLTAYAAQTGTIGLAAAVAAGAALALSLAQRALSTPARAIRRRTRALTGLVEDRQGVTTPIDAAWVLAPLERALRWTAWGVVGVAIALVAAHAT